MNVFKKFTETINRDINQINISDFFNIKKKK